MLHRPSDAARALGVSTQTLRAWHRQGTIVAEQTVSGHRRYVIPAKFAATEDNADDHDPSYDIVYARVSSRKQRGDLERQIATLRSHHPGHRVVSDNGSGLNFKRKGLLHLLDLAFEGRLRNVVVTHRDRLARFGFDLVEHILSRHGAVVTVLFPPEVEAGDGGTSELADDLLAIVTVFAARHHGRRSSQRKRRGGGGVDDEVPKDSDLSDDPTTKAIHQDDGGVPVHLQQSKRQGHRADE